MNHKLIIIATSNHFDAPSALGAVPVSIAFFLRLAISRRHENMDNGTVVNGRHASQLMHFYVIVVTFVVDAFAE